MERILIQVCAESDDPINGREGKDGEKMEKMKLIKKMKRRDISETLN